MSIHRTVRSEVDLKYVVNIGAYSSGPFTQRDDRDSITLHSAPAESHNHPHDHDHSTEPHSHQPTHYEMRGITSLQVTCPVLSSTQYTKLDEWIRTVLWEHRLPDHPEATEASIDVLRCKGLFSMDSGKKYVLQGVRSVYVFKMRSPAVQSLIPPFSHRNLYDMTPVDSELVGVPEEGKLVLIGKGLDGTVRASLEALFR